MIHPSAKIDPTARVNCPDLHVGAGSVVGRNCLLEGTRIVIGREAWLDEGARIGGGSCFDPGASLVAGDFLHCGKGSELNIGCGITLGDEVGIGVETKVFTHGAWLSEFDGYPCTFAPVVVGSRVWLPHAWVNPGVTIGDDVVVMAGSVVNKNLPRGCLAAGSPARVVAAGAFPQPMDNASRAACLDRILAEVAHAADATHDGSRITIRGWGTTFDCVARTIAGPVTRESEAMRNQLRRHGIRFRYSDKAGYYEAWS